MLLALPSKRWVERRQSRALVGGAGPVMSELGFAIARLKVPFTPGRKDKTAKECPAWDGPTCKEHCSGCANLRVSLSLSLCARGWPPAQRGHGQP